MLKFNGNGNIAENTVIDQIILETALADQTISVNQFKGAVVVDPNLGNYVVIDFTVTDTAAMNIGRIRLMNGQTPVAISEDKQLLIVKEANKNLKIRLAAQFAGAENCKFNTTSVNLPYATPFREGVVRFNNGEEINKSGTVYSAKDVDDKINAVTDSLGNLDQYAKKAEPNEFTAANTFTAGITVNGEIGGTAVTDAGADGDKHIVNVGYADNKYLSKQIAEATYLSKNDAGSLYLTKEAAAANYAKLDGGNTFTGDVNTFKEVNATKFSGDGVSSEISADAVNNDTRLPTCAAVATFVDGKTSTLTQTITALQGKDNNLQSQIDGINAGQNLADIVTDTAKLADYDISHLKAKNDQHGAEGATWEIGDKVQVLGGGDVQSSVYELTKGDMPGGEGNIACTHWAGYYWRYIGVYGKNAYTKSEIDKKVTTINSAIGTKADQTYVDNKLAEKVDKTQITTAISGNTATNENIPSVSAVKTYVDTVAGDFVTLDTTQEITGAKTFANGNITIANKDNKTSHYVTIGAGGNNTTSDYTSSIIHYDLTHNDYAYDQFVRPRGESDNVSYTSSLSRRGTDSYTFGSRLEQHIGTHYNYTASDMYMTTGDPNKVSPLPGAQIGTPGNTAITDETLKENYVERIRLRKNTSTVDNVEGGFLSAGTSVTDIDLFADNINNVFSKEVSFRVCTPSDNGMTDKSVLRIYSSGIWYRTQDGNSIGEPEYRLRTAGSLDFTTSMSELVGSDSYVPTTKAVATFVGNAITANQNATSNKDQVGAMGLFLYTGGDSKTMGDEVEGTSLQAVGMQLPMDGVVSWSQGTAMAGKWRLLNNTIAGEPCLVLAIRVE